MNPLLWSAGQQCARQASVWDARGDGHDKDVYLRDRAGQVIVGTIINTHPTLGKVAGEV